MDFFLNKTAIKIENVSKCFGKDFFAVRDINFDVKYGEIHCLIGENGAGKSTLFKLLNGSTQATTGSFFFQGKKLNKFDSEVARDIQIGMVHQHFSLINEFTIYENVILGFEKSFDPKSREEYSRRLIEIYKKDKRFLKKAELSEGSFDEIIKLKRWLTAKERSFLTNSKATRRRVEELKKSLDFKFDIDKKVSDLRVSERQKVEILKVIFQDSEILLFDESTATLNNKEVDFFLSSLKRLKAAGKAIVFITHKINEVLEVADRISVLSLGRIVARFENPKKITKNELIDSLMIKEDLKKSSSSFSMTKKKKFDYKKPLLEVKDLNLTGKKGFQYLKNISFEAFPGEILAFAGIEGHGQQKVFEVISGLETNFLGKISCHKSQEKTLEWKGLDINDVRANGIVYLPKDRIKESLLADGSMLQNISFNALDSSDFFRLPPFFFYNTERTTQKLEQIVKDYNVKGYFNPRQKIESLSGGNQQKFLIGRELLRSPKVFLVDEPTWGVDPISVKQIFNRLIDVRNDAKAVIIIFQDVNDIVDIADRILVFSKGRIVSEIKNPKNKDTFKRILEAMTFKEKS